MGLDRYSLSEDERLEDSSYLQSLSVLGNQMMLDIMKNRLNAGKKPKSGDPGEFTLITELLSAITSSYGQNVNKDNFPTRYGNMLIKYSELINACETYDKTRSKKKHISKTARNIEANRLEQVSQISSIAQQEMSVIRTHSGRMANNKMGMTWREMFSSQGRLEKVKSDFSENHPEKDGEGSLEEQLRSVKLKHAGAPAKKKPSSEQSEATDNAELINNVRRNEKELKNEVESLKTELAEMKNKYSSMQVTLDTLMKGKTETTGVTKELSENDDLGGYFGA